MSPRGHVRLRAATTLCCVWLSTVGVAGQTVSLQEDPDCAGCVIRAELKAVLGGSGTDYVGPSMMIDSNSKGQFILAHDQAADEIRVFDSRGRFVRIVGREGHGPGEYEGIRAICVLPGDTVLVFDGKNAAETTLGPGFDLIESRRFPLPAISPGGVVAFSSNEIVANASVSTPERVGLPLHLVEAGKGIVRSFGSDDGAYRADVDGSGTRRISRGSNGTVWSMRINEYVLEQWSTDGRKVRALRREVDWFRTWYRYPSVVDGQHPMPPMTRAVHEDSAGLVWVAVELPGGNWAKQGLDAETADGRRFIPDPVKAWDTMVEVIDPIRGFVLGSVRHPGRVLFITSHGDMVINAERDDGTPTLEIWSFSLARNMR